MMEYILTKGKTRMKSDGRSRPICWIMENRILRTKNLPYAIWSKLNPPGKGSLSWQITHALLHKAGQVNLYMQQTGRDVHLVQDSLGSILALCNPGARWSVFLCLGFVISKMRDKKKIYPIELL